MNTIVSKLFFSLIVCVLFFSSCSKDGIVVAPKAITALIQDIKSQNPGCTCNPYLNQYTWRNETLYVLGYKGPSCDWAPVFYHSDGQKFTLDAGYTYAAFLQESILVRNVWTCN